MARVGVAVGQRSASAEGEVALAIEGAAGTYLAKARRSPRPDVVAALGKPAYANDGFRAQASLAEVAAGDYRLAVLLRDGARTFLCDGLLRVRVRG